MRSSSQLLNLFLCDVLVMSHDVNLSGSSSKTFPWVVPFMSPFPLSFQSQIGVPAFPLCCSILAIFFLSPFPFASLAFACLFQILFTSFDQATALPEPIAGAKDAHRYMKEKLTLLRWVCCWQDGQWTNKLNRLKVSECDQKYRPHSIRHHGFSIHQKLLWMHCGTVPVMVGLEAYSKPPKLCSDGSSACSQCGRDEDRLGPAIILFHRYLMIFDCWAIVE